MFSFGGLIVGLKLMSGALIVGLKSIVGLTLIRAIAFNIFRFALAITLNCGASSVSIFSFGTLIVGLKLMSGALIVGLKSIVGLTLIRAIAFNIFRFALAINLKSLL